MSNEILKNIAESFRDIDPRMKEAEDLIRALKDAGEDTTAIEADVRAMKTRRDKWERMLKARGLL